MTKQEQAYLQQIQNTLMEVSVRGNDTLLMSECLKAIQSLIAAPVEGEQEEE